MNTTITEVIAMIGVYMLMFSLTYLLLRMCMMRYEADMTAIFMSSLLWPITLMVAPLVITATVLLMIKRKIDRLADSMLVREQFRSESHE